jgi:hypothetical protein
MCLACGHDCDKSKFVYDAPQDEQVVMCPEHYALSTLPLADRPTGEWNPYYTKREHNHVFNCKLCGYTFIVLQGNDNMNFCPNCGVDMLNGQTVH